MSYVQAPGTIRIDLVRMHDRKVQTSRIFRGSDAYCIVSIVGATCTTRALGPGTLGFSTFAATLTRTSEVDRTLKTDHSNRVWHRCPESRHAILPPFTKRRDSGEISSLGPALVSVSVLFLFCGDCGG